MSTYAAQPHPRKPTREEGLAIAAQRRAARGRRTSHIRKAVATVAAAAFLGPFAVIYINLTAGKDPALAATTSPAQSTTTSQAQSTTTASSASTSSPAPVTTQQS
jgi:hypothetical protein